MFHELCNPVTMRLVAPGHPLHNIEELCSSPLPGFRACRNVKRLAAGIVLWVVLLCTMTDFTTSGNGKPQQARDDKIRPGCALPQGSVIAGICGILPAIAGTAGTQSRTLLHR